MLVPERPFLQGPHRAHGLQRDHEGRRGEGGREVGQADAGCPDEDGGGAGSMQAIEPAVAS